MGRVLAGLAALSLILTARAYYQPSQQQMAPTSDLAASTEADLKALRKLSDEYGALVTARDVSGFLNLFADGAVLMPPDQKMVKGKESIRCLVVSAFARDEASDFQEITTPEEMRVTGQWAFDRGVTTLTTRPKGGAPTVRYNKYIRIWQKADTKGWKLARVIWNPNGDQGPRGGVPVTSGGNATTSETDIPSVEAVLGEYVAALKSGNADQYAALFTEDAVFMAPGRPALFGRQAIWEAVRNFFQRATEELEPTMENVSLAGDWAFAHGTFSLTVVPNDGGGREYEQGKFLWIFERHSSGSWKIARYLWNYD